MIRSCYIIFLLLLPFIHSGQELIFQWEFDGNDMSNFTTQAGDCEQNVITPGIFGPNNGSFEIRNIEGNQCCPCAFGGGPDECGFNDNIATSQLVILDTNAYCNITIRADVILEGGENMDCAVPSAPTIFCDADQDPGRDAMKIEILVPGQFIELGSYCGDIRNGSFILEDFSFSFFSVIITGGTQAQDEAYLIERIVVEGTPKSLVPVVIEANNQAPCDGQDALLLSVPAAESMSTYQWTFNGMDAGTTESLAFFPVTAAQSGLYEVTVTEPGGCSDSDEITISVMTCLPNTVTFSNLETDYCKNNDRLMLSSTSDEGVTGTWNVDPNTRLDDTAYFDQIIFTPDPIYNIDPQVYDLRVDTIPPMGVFPIDGLPVCVFEGPDQEINLVDLLQLVEPNIIDVNGFGRNFPDVVDLVNLDVSEIVPGSYPFEFESIPAGECKSSLEFVNLIISKIDRGNDNSIALCEQDNTPVDFLSLVSTSPNPSGRFVDTDNTGVDLTFPQQMDLSTLTPGQYTFEYTTGGTVNCPNLSHTAVLEVTILPGALSRIERTDLCEEDGFSLVIGTDTYDEDTPTGTTILPGQAANGCDSTVEVNLVFNELRFSDVFYFGCTGDGFDTLVNGTLYSESNPFGEETLTASNGCDSTITIDLIYESLEEKNITHDGCVNDGFFQLVNGIRYDEQNPTGLDTVVGNTGCDTIVTIDLTFKPNASGSESFTGNSGDPYEVIVNGTTYNEANPSGTEIFPAANGCDSVVTINLVFRLGFLDSINTIHCTGDGYFVEIGNSVYNEQNPSGVDSLKSRDDRDSVIITNLEFQSPGINNVVLIKTSGSGFDTTFNNITYSESNAAGTDTIPFGAANGCDSIINVELTFVDAFVTNIDTSLCTGDPFQLSIGNSVYNESNPSGRDTFLTAAGVDSFVITQLTFNEPSAFVFTDDRCSGDGFEFIVGTDIFNEANPSGIITLPGADKNGCDSLVQVLLIYTNDILISISDTICPDAAIQVGTSIYNAQNLSGVDTIFGQDGCDTIFTTALSIDTLLVDFCTTPSCPNEDNGILKMYNLQPGKELSVQFEGEIFTLRDSLEIGDLSGGNYNYSIISELGCATDFDATVDRLSISNPQITTSQVGLDTIQLGFNFEGIVDSINWDAAVGTICSDCMSVNIDGRITNLITLTIIDDNSCTYMATFQLGDSGSEEDVIYYMPNAITQFGDIGNGRFFLQTTDPRIVDYDLQIFTRWGNLVYEERNLNPNDPALGWDGSFGIQELQSNVYVYKLTIRTFDGTFVSRAGDLLVIR